MVESVLSAVQMSTEISAEELPKNSEALVESPATDLLTLQRLVQEREVEIVQLKKELKAESQLRITETTALKQRLGDLNVKYQSLRTAARERILALQEMPPESEMSLIMEAQRLQSLLREQQADFRCRLNDQQRLRARQEQQYREQVAELRGRVSELESLLQQRQHVAVSSPHRSPQQQQQQHQRSLHTLASRPLSAGGVAGSVPEARRVAESAGQSSTGVGYAATLLARSGSASARDAVLTGSALAAGVAPASPTVVSATIERLQRSLLALQALCARKDAEIDNLREELIISRQELQHALASPSAPPQPQQSPPDGAAHASVSASVPTVPNAEYDHERTTDPLSLAALSDGIDDAGAAASPAEEPSPSTQPPSSKSNGDTETLVRDLLQATRGIDGGVRSLRTLLVRTATLSRSVLKRMDDARGGGSGSGVRAALEGKIVSRTQPRMLS